MLIMTFVSGALDLIGMISFMLDMASKMEGASDEGVDVSGDKISLTIYNTFVVVHVLSAIGVMIALIHELTVGKKDHKF